MNVEPSRVRLNGMAEQIIGSGAAMQQVYKTIGRIVKSDATVLLQGESGTGKELVAQVIHHHSARWRAPFIAINCSAIPLDLEAEIEIFAKTLLLHRSGQILIGRGDDADIRLDCLASPNAGKFAFLEDTQKFRLEWEGHVADLVKEERTSSCLLKLAGMPFNCTGEGSTFMAE